MTEPKPTRPGVLIVDDEPDVRAYLGLALSREGFRVWAADGARQALELLRANPADIGVALVDVRMPGLDGPATLHELRRIKPDLRCLLMLGGLPPEDAPEAVCDGVLLKPFALSDVAAHLQGLWPAP